MQHRGLTIIEVLFSIIILAVTLAGGASIYFYVMQITKQASHRNIAVQMANSKMEALRSVDYNSLLTSSANISINGWDMIQNVIITDIGSYKQAQVEIKWHESNKAADQMETVKLSTYISP